MQAERWQQIDAIFQSALDCLPGDRPALLDSACAADPGLRREIESLLSLHENSEPTNDGAVMDAMKILAERDARRNEGRGIGAYCVLREIGRGGMGNVYLAARADDAFQKVVAIKIIRRGLDTDDIIQRFRAERQILAMLDHPNIARLLDGGTTDDGLPYFVMEYIEGEPIDEFCDAHKLTVADRLRLFQSVCSAVSYAHRHLIIHRDIKSANVLVTKERVPKLLDFGIAKLLSPEPGPQQRTQTGSRLLTPEYASPEQVRAEPITTASDVYSLGVLLFRLLTGQGPYRSRMLSALEVERAICIEEPGKPSDRAPEARQLKGDLDTIVLTALRKDPRRRYATVNQLSEDVRRYLANLPIAARADTRSYRAAKFIQRNKAWVAMAAITFLSLAGGIAASLWQTHVARQQRDLARLEQVKSARISAFLQEMVGYSGVTGGSPNHNAHDATVEDMLDDAARRVETELDDQPEVKAEMLGTIGGTYLAQAKYDKSAPYLREAYELDLKLYGPDARQTASVMHPLADLAYATGDYVAADSWFEKALPIYRKHANDPGFDIHLIPAMLSDAAFVKKAIGRLDEAEVLWREALSYAPRLPARYRAQGMAPKTFLAQLYIDRGDVEKADLLATEASNQLRAFGGDRFSLAQSLIDLGNVRRLERRYAEADAAIQEGTDLFTRALGADHPNVAYGLMSLATSRYHQARYGDAERDARRALAIVGKLPASSHFTPAVYLALGAIMTKTGRPQQAEPMLRDVLAVARQNSQRPNDLADAAGRLGECLAAQKRYAEAEPLLIESYQIFKRLHVPHSPALSEARDRLLALYAASGKPSIHID